MKVQKGNYMKEETLVMTANAQKNVTKGFVMKTEKRYLMSFGNMETTISKIPIYMAGLKSLVLNVGTQKWTKVGGTTLCPIQYCKILLKLTFVKKHF